MFLKKCWKQITQAKLHEIWFSSMKNHNSYLAGTKKKKKKRSVQVLKMNYVFGFNYRRVRGWQSVAYIVDAHRSTAMMIVSTFFFSFIFFEFFFVTFFITICPVQYQVKDGRKLSVLYALQNVLGNHFWECKYPDLKLIGYVKCIVSVRKMKKKKKNLSRKWEHFAHRTAEEQQQQKKDQCAFKKHKKHLEWN